MEPKNKKKQSPDAKHDDENREEKIKAFIGKAKAGTGSVDIAVKPSSRQAVKPSRKKFTVRIDLGLYERWIDFSATRKKIGNDVNLNQYLTDLLSDALEKEGF